VPKLALLFKNRRRRARMLLGMDTAETGSGVYRGKRDRDLTKKYRK
jgi:hypothetical protein